MKVLREFESHLFRQIVKYQGAYNPFSFYFPFVPSLDLANGGNGSDGSPVLNDPNTGGGEHTVNIIGTNGAGSAGVVLVAWYQ